MLIQDFYQTFYVLNLLMIDSAGSESVKIWRLKIESVKTLHGL